MKRLIKILSLLIILIFHSTGCKKPSVGLKDAYNNRFLIGVALNDFQILGGDSITLPIVLENFNSIVAENCMKSEVIQPRKGVFNFAPADRFVEFGVKNNLFIVGHCLVWHSQAPDWFFVDNNGNDVSRDTLIERMRYHIAKLVGRYKGFVNGWDVVNEALTDDGNWRESKFYKIIGEDYIELAFRFAHQADPGAELYYNDYNLEKPEKRKALVKLVKSLIAKGVKIDAVGIQGHCTMSFPEYADMDSAISAIGSLGVKVMITEMDITVLPWPEIEVTADVNLRLQNDAYYNPFPVELTDSARVALDNRWATFFGIFLKHQDLITRVTLWGLHDQQSWRNNWPIYGRRDYPLLFDRNYQPKPIVGRLIKMGLNSK